VSLDTKELVKGQALVIGEDYGRDN